MGMSLKTGQFYEFGSFRLVPDERLLLRDGRLVPLSPKSFDVLEVLVRNSGHLLEKDELIKAVWPDAFVEEGNLTLNISHLRKALGADLDPRGYIETVPKRGYRFVAPVVVGGLTQPAPEPRTLPVRRLSARWLVAAGIVAAITAGWLRWLPARAVNPEAYDLMVRGKRHALRTGASEMELARELLSQSVRMDPTNSQANAWLAYTLHSQYAMTMGSEETIQSAEMFAQKAFALGQRSIVARYALIHMVEFGVPAETGLKLGREALAAEPDNLDAVAAAAEAYFRAGIQDKAIQLLEKVIRADPSRAQVRRQLVRSLLFRGEYERGLEIAFEQGERAAGSVWTMLLYKELGRFEEAKKYASSDFKTFNGYFEWYMAGCVFEAAGDLPRAREVWTEGAGRVESLLAVREHQHARAFLGVMYAKLGLREQALEQAGRLMAAHPRSSYVPFFMAQLHAILGNRREALDCLRLAVDSGFRMLPFLYYHTRPALAFQTLGVDPEFLAFRDGLEKKVRLLEAPVR